MNFTVLDCERIAVSRAYKEYPYIESLVQVYENKPYLFMKSSVNWFGLYKSQDKSKILLSACLTRREFNHIEFIIDVESNKLLWHGTDFVHVTMYSYFHYHSYKNMFMRIIKDYDWDFITYNLIGTNYKKEYGLMTNENLNIKLLLKLCRLIKLVS